MSTLGTIAILVGPDYEDLEVWYPKLRLEEAGYHTPLIGNGEASYHGKWGYPATMDGQVADLDPTTLRGLVAPGGSDRAIQHATSLLTACSWIMLPLAAAGWTLQGLMASTHTGQRRRVLLTDNALVASLVVLFAVASPLVSFPVYFCGWHSARGLERLRRELGESWPELARSLAPATMGAIALVGLAAWFVLGGAGWNGTLIRATFVGLSAVAVPHLILHGVAPLCEASARRRTQSLHFGSPV